MNVKTIKKVKSSIASLSIIFFSLLVFLPIVLMVSLSLKTNGELITNPFGLSLNLEWGNYLRAIEEMDYLQSLSNSVVITGFASFGATFLSVMTAYAIARAQKCRKFFKALSIFFWIGIALPIQTVIVPLVLWMNTLGLSNTKFGLILVFIASNAAFGVFFFTGFVQTVPISLEEAALIDGASKFTTFGRIVFPLLKTPFITLLIIMILRVYNNFLFPLILLQGQDSRTLPLTVYFFRGDNEVAWNLLFAATTLVVLPLMIVYFIFQKQIISGIMSGSVKM